MTGGLFPIPLSPELWTVGQLCTTFKLSYKHTLYTFALFDVTFPSEEELKLEAETLDLTSPIIICSMNGQPFDRYADSLFGKREIAYKNAPDFKKEISLETGLLPLRQNDLQRLLKPFFGLLPWDCYYRDDYVDQFLLPGTVKRSDVRYLKDYTTDELRAILPPDLFKLKERLRVEKEEHG